ncbi:MAG TPA: APC family permease [Terriglobia bacterium]|nr:APC family permease [Terriglobia bacterium]
MSTDLTLPSGVAAPPRDLELRRDVTVWGSFMWGYADVGADIYTALGLVIAAAQGAASMAFAAAGLVYIMVGLAYTELASAYPVAGGGQYFTLRGLGDFWGYVAGAALLLDYTIDIALFAVASVGYLNFFFPYFFHYEFPSPQWSLGFISLYKPYNVIEAVLLIGFLVWLNIRGIRESSLFNEILGAIDILTESSIIIFGFCAAWRPELLASQWREAMHTVSLKQFAYGFSLAIISFVGLESISQAAQETRRPATIIPRTSITLIFTVFIFAVAFSNLALGVLPWKEFEIHMDDPVALLAHNIPILGFIAGPFAAFLGTTILAISANSGIMSASRLTFSMSQLELISPWFHAVHHKYRTPVRTIIFFSAAGALAVVLSGLTPKLLDTLGNMYAFGATLGYILVFISLIRLRFIDPYTPRPYQVPLNIPWRKGEREFHIPILGFLGLLGVSTIFFTVIATHAIGRIAGPAWVLICLLYYWYYRKRNGMPVTRSLPRDWEKLQMEVLTSAEEYDLLEIYKTALSARDRLLRREKATPQKR